MSQESINTNVGLIRQTFLRTRIARSGLVAIVLSLSLTGCTDLLNSLSKSDVSPDELRSVLLTSSHFNGQWTETQPDSVATQAFDRELEKIGDEVCDVEGMVDGPIFQRDEGALVAYSTAEAVCGSTAETIQVTKDSIDTIRAMQENGINSIAASYELGIRNFRANIVNLGLGSNAVAIHTTAEFVGEGTSVLYDQLSVTVVNDRAAVTVTIEAYGQKAPVDVLTRLVSTVKTRLAAIE